MCGDPNAPPARDSADLIAIIHSSASASASAPPTHPRLPAPPFSARLSFSNRDPGATSSRLALADARTGPLRVRIHKFGSPLTGPNPVVHSFGVDARGRACTGGVRLDLGVGGDGVVGRTVSVVDGEGGVLGEGVIGWWGGE